MLLTVIWLINYLYYLIISIQNVHINDIQFLSTSFTLVSDLGFFSFIFLLLKSVWIDNRKVLYLLKQTKLEITTNDQENVKPIVLYRGVQLLIVFGFIAYTYFDSNLLVPLNFNEHVNSSNISEIFQDDDPFMWGFEKLSSRLSFLPYRNVIILLLEVHIHKFFYISHAFMFLLSCTIYALGWQFKRDILLADCSNIGVGILAYRKLKYKLETIKDFTGPHVFAFHVVNIAYYCQVPEIIFGNLKFETMPSVILYVFINISVWILAAEFHVQIESSFCRWHDKCMFQGDEASNETAQGTQSHISVETQLKLMSIKNEFITHPLGLSCQFFIVTYGFLGTVINHN